MAARVPSTGLCLAEVSQTEPRGVKRGEVLSAGDAADCNVYARTLGRELLGCDIQVQIARESDWPYGATYGRGTLTFNLAKCGHRFFDNGVTDDVNRALIHEFGHHYESDHLSEGYYRSLSDLGARLARLALTKPELFS